MKGAFQSAIEPNGRYGAVFERDDETAYFYLLDLERPGNRRIIEAFNVRLPDAFAPGAPVSVIWGSTRRIVGLIVQGDPIAVFDLTVPSPHGRRATHEDMIDFRET